jgi:hypothetical protein
MTKEQYNEMLVISYAAGFRVPVALTEVPNEYRYLVSETMKKWLREVHNISVTAFSFSQESWTVKVNKPSIEGDNGNIEQLCYKGEDYNTYEDSIENGLLKALNFIEDGSNN